MSIFDNEKGQFAPEPSNQPEIRYDVPLLLHLQPLQIDLTKPDRLLEGVAESITGVSGSKLVGDILAADHHIAVLYIQGDGRELPPHIMLAGDTEQERTVLKPGDTRDASENPNEGKCIVTFGENGTALTVRSEHPDAGYAIYTDVVKPDYVPEFTDFSDDPDYPFEGL